MALSNDDKVEVLRKAIALYLECEEAEIGNFIFGVERQDGEAVMFSGGWSALPHWYLLGMVNELRAMLEKQRQSPQNGLVQIPTEIPPELRQMFERQ